MSLSLSLKQCLTHLFEGDNSGNAPDDLAAVRYASYSPELISTLIWVYNENWDNYKSQRLSYIIIFTLDGCFIILHLDAIEILVVCMASLVAMGDQTLVACGCQPLNKWNGIYTHIHLKLSVCVDHVHVLVVLDLYEYWEIIYNAKLMVSPWSSVCTRVWRWEIEWRNRYDLAARRW